MLDINRIRENPEKIKELLKRKLWDTDFTELLKWDEERKAKLKFVEDGKAEKNKLTSLVPQMKRNGEDVAPIFQQVKEIDAKIKNTEVELGELEVKIHDFLAELPNTPDEDLLGGGKENNKVIRVVNEIGRAHV